MLIKAFIHRSKLESRSPLMRVEKRVHLKIIEISFPKAEPKISPTKIKNLSLTLIPKSAASKVQG
ncbi:unnamed protein product [Moneuplotes crassus]|uniref:Uncharacterized protein n=1 Tax=Euplotes crassus TaxID=5936 RepID=A0AAD1X8H7_EUPCR|nr:unnamed protein product [Moneuplotes crassus]